jgi:hypothetical protein
MTTGLALVEQQASRALRSSESASETTGQLSGWQLLPKPNHVGAQQLSTSTTRGPRSQQERQVVHYSCTQGFESPTFPMPRLAGAAHGEPAGLMIGAFMRLDGHPTDRRAGAAAHATEFQQILNTGSRS